MNSSRVLIVDSFPIVREGIRSLLEGAPERWLVCGTAGDGAEAVLEAARLHPDIVIMDDQLPELAGLLAAEEMRRDFPAVEIIIYTRGLSPRDLLEAYHSAASGCLLKTEPLEELLIALNAVSHGHRFRSRPLVELCEEIAASIARHEPLTPREVQTLRAIVAGLSDKEIASKLGVSVKTVDTHRTHLRRKLNLHSTAELLHYAWRIGLCER